MPEGLEKTDGTGPPLPSHGRSEYRICWHQAEESGDDRQRHLWVRRGVQSVDRLEPAGGIVVKGLSIEPMGGAASPRLEGTPSGMLNAVGLQNVGVGEFVSSRLPLLRGYRTRIFANVFGFTTEEYVRVVEVLNESEGLAGYEINISCPNVKCGGQMYGSDPRATREVVEAVKSRARRPVVVKLSPNVTDIRELARAAEDGGADALSLVNTLTGMSVDVESFRPRLGNLTGGLSGPAIKPVALRMVYEVVRR